MAVLVFRQPNTSLTKRSGVRIRNGRLEVSTKEVQWVRSIRVGGRIRDRDGKVRVREFTPADGNKYLMALRIALAVLLLAGCSALTSAQLDPNAGKVTFGRSLDTTSFVLSGEATSFPVGGDVAYRAALSKVMNQGNVRLSGTLNGTVVVDSTNAVTEDVWTLYGGTLPGSLLFEAGTFQLRVLDIGNNELAVGSFTVTE